MAACNVPSDRSSDNPSILSRDRQGNEHELHVADHPAGMISISDNRMFRVMAPSAALALVMKLVHALGSPRIAAH
jgi:hypothetical protein